MDQSRPQDSSQLIRRKLESRSLTPHHRSVKSSSNIILTNDVEVDGKLNSSSYVTLSKNVIVREKIQSSGKVTLSDGVKVFGKVGASGAVELRNGIWIGEKVEGAFSYFLCISLPSCLEYAASRSRARIRL